MAGSRDTEEHGSRSLLNVNIGTILFGAIFIYILVSIVIYATTKHVSTYQVIEGPLAQNQTYTALCLREEEIINANSGGYVHYYAQEGRKISKAGAVYSLSQEPQEVNGDARLSEESLSRVRSMVADFSNSFNPSHFSQVYSFKYSLAGNVLNYAQLDGEGNGSVVGNEAVFTAPRDGMIVYALDGLETVTTENFTAADLTYASYDIRNLKTTERVEAGDPVYKLITSESWSIVIPLSSAQASKLDGKERIKCCFLKDDRTITGDLKLISRSDGLFGIITFTSGNYRYGADRYLEVELITNAQKGLKIPITSIVTKDFYVIPREFGVEDEKTSATRFIRSYKDEDGISRVETVDATIYERTEDYYFVDMEEFSQGDLILQENTNQSYSVSKTAQLEGVYSINKGYTVFRKIVIIDQNEEYCIVSTGTTYGLSLYDNIILDSSTVHEDEILF